MRWVGVHVADWTDDLLRPLRKMAGADRASCRGGRPQPRDGRSPEIDFPVQSVDYASGRAVRRRDPDDVEYAKEEPPTVAVTMITDWRRGGCIWRTTRGVR